MRKTIKTADIVAMVNTRNSCSTCSPATRVGWNSLLEEILAETGNYGGFRYLNRGQVPTGEKPGIDGNRPDCTFPDETRRHYWTRNTALGGPNRV